jgi:hypothetical protein
MIPIFAIDLLLLVSASGGTPPGRSPGARGPAGAPFAASGLVGVALQCANAPLQARHLLLQRVEAHPERFLLAGGVGGRNRRDDGADSDAAAPPLPSPAEAGAGAPAETSSKSSSESSARPLTGSSLGRVSGARARSTTRHRSLSHRSRSISSRHDSISFSQARLIAVPHFGHDL